MNVLYKFDKEPIELLLGLGGAVQYLDHVPCDELNYLVSVKTKTGNKQIIIPIEAVRMIQSRKPANEVIESIKRQLATESSDDAVPLQTPEPIRPAFTFWRRFLGLFGIHDRSR